MPVPQVRPDRRPLVAHLGVLLVGYVGLVGLLRGTWFRGDDFEFLANRVGADRSLSIWYPHNEHWSTGPIAVWRVLYDAVGITSALPYLAASVAAHCLVVHLLWRLMVRAGVAPWVAVGLSGVMLALGVGWENITWAFQLGFMGSFALGLAATLWCLRDGRSATVGAVLVSVLALTFSGVAIPFAISSTLCLLLRRRVRRAVTLAATTAAVYLVWFATYGHLAPPAPHTQNLLQRLSAAASWAWQLLTNALAGLTSLEGFGGVLVLVVTAALVIGLRTTVQTQGGWYPAAGWDGAVLVVLTCVFNLLLQTVSLAANRNDISAPGASRYLYFIVALLLPAIGVLLTRAQGATGKLVPVVFTGYLVVTQGLILVAQERQFEAAPLRSDTLGLAALVDGGEPVTNVGLAVDLDVEAITKWVAEGALDPSTAPDQSVLDARALGQVVASTSNDVPGAGTVLVAGEELDPAAEECLTAEVPPANEAAVVSLVPGQSVGVTNEDAGNLTFQVLDGDSASRLVTAPASPNDPLWLSVTAPTELRIVSDNGQDITFCNP